MAKSQPYADNGVLISKSSIALGDDIEVSYKGLLAECGANEVFLYAGYGDNWEDNFLLPMENDGSEFKVNFKVSKSGSLNITFRDSAFNWDNNSAENYSFEVKKTKITKVKKETEKTAKTATKTTKAKTSTTKAKKTTSKVKSSKK